MGYADSAKKQTEAAWSTKEVAAKQKADDHRQAYETRKQELEAGEINQIFESTWKPKIDEACSRGESQISILLGSNQSHDRSLTPDRMAVKDVGEVFLRAEGFKVEFRDNYKPTIGSDDPYGNHTYFELIVSW